MTTPVGYAIASAARPIGQDARVLDLADRVYLAAMSAVQCPDAPADSATGRSGGPGR